MVNSTLVWMGKYGYMEPLEAGILRERLSQLGENLLEDTKTEEDSPINE